MTLKEEIKDAMGNENLLHDIRDSGDAIEVTYNYGSVVDLQALDDYEVRRLVVENGRATITYAKDSYPARD